MPIDGRLRLEFMGLNCMTACKLTPEQWRTGANIV